MFGFLGLSAVNLIRLSLNGFGGMVMPVSHFPPESTKTNWTGDPSGSDRTAANRYLQQPCRHDR